MVAKGAKLINDTAIIYIKNLMKNIFLITPNIPSEI